MALEVDAVTGLLPNPPALHPASLSEVEQVFVWPDMPERLAIWANFMRHVEAVRGLLPGERVEEWLDGGFTTAKNAPPRDIDFVTWIDVGTINRLPDDDRAELWSLFRGGPSPRPVPKCDAYLVPVWPEGSPARAVTLKAQEYWRWRSGTQRPHEGGRQKGIVQIRI